jgi:hypothetical protein
VHPTDWTSAAKTYQWPNTDATILGVRSIKGNVLGFPELDGSELGMVLDLGKRLGQTLGPVHRKRDSIRFKQDMIHSARVLDHRAPLSLGN